MSQCAEVVLHIGYTFISIQYKEAALGDAISEVTFIVARSHFKEGTILDSCQYMVQNKCNNLKSMTLSSFVPRPKEEVEKRLGFSCLHASAYY